MSSNIVYPQGRVELTIVANESVAVYSKGDVNVSRKQGFPNHPEIVSALTPLLGAAVGGAHAVYGPYTTGATIIIEPGAAEAFYETGVAPVVQFGYNVQDIQPAPVAVDVTGAVSAAAMLTGIVTSSTAAAVAGTIPTGTVMDAASEFAINDSFEWSVINTGPNTFTVTAAATHTIVGAAAVATATSGRFRTRKTAANTFVTYRVA
ncbi:MAG: hypothetical protein V4641_21570 [Pseudomonadota bacterium]